MEKEHSLRRPFGKANENSEINKIHLEEKISSLSSQKVQDALVYNKSDGSPWRYTECVWYGTLKKSDKSLSLP